VDSNTAKVVVFDFDLPESQNPLYSNTIRYHQNVQASATRYSNQQQGAISYFGTWAAFVSTPTGITTSSIGLYSPYGPTRLFSTVAASVNPTLFTFPRGAVATYFTESNTHAYMTVTDAGIFSTYITPTVSNATTTNINLYSNANSLGFIIRDTTIPNSNMMYSFLYHNSTLFYHSTMIGANFSISTSAAGTIGRTSNAIHNFIFMPTTSTTYYLAPGLPPSSLSNATGTTFNTNNGWYSLLPPCEVSYGIEQTVGSSKAHMYSNGTFISSVNLPFTPLNNNSLLTFQRTENALFLHGRTGFTYHGYARISTNALLTEGGTNINSNLIPQFLTTSATNSSATRTGAVFHVTGTSTVSGSGSTIRMVIYYNISRDRFETPGTIMSNFQNWYSTYEKRSLFY
jgi:hypothetical protein